MQTHLEVALYDRGRTLAKEGAGSLGIISLLLVSSLQKNSSKQTSSCPSPEDPAQRVAICLEDSETYLFAHVLISLFIFMQLRVPKAPNSQKTCCY